MNEHYPRDMVGYGREPPDPRWPGGARLALQFVINYEEGGENCILHGDDASEAFLSEIIGAPALPGARNMNMESIYEYGSRAGFWRLHRAFTGRGMPVTVYGVAMALARNPEAVAAMNEASWEIASHGYRWIDYQHVSEEVEREHIRTAIDVHTAATGQRPLGWYTGRISPNTRRLVVEAGDMRFATSQGFNSGEQFFAYLKDAFDVLYREGETQPRMMSVGLHCRLAGRPGRAAALERFLDYAQEHEGAWICRRVDIARHWHTHHAPRT